jgi:hypothetical protein
MIIKNTVLRIVTIAIITVHMSPNNSTAQDSCTEYGILLDQLYIRQEFALTIFQYNVWNTLFPECQRELLPPVLRSYYHQGDFKSTISLFTQHLAMHSSAITLPEQKIGLSSFILSGNSVPLAMPWDSTLLPIASLWNHYTTAKYDLVINQLLSIQASDSIYSGEIKDTTLASLLASAHVGHLNKLPAAVAGIIPGGSYFVAGYPSDGFFQLLLVTMGYSLSAWYYYLDAPIQSALFGSLGGWFHLSGWYGGVQAIDTKNKKNTETFAYHLHYLFYF